MLDSSAAFEVSSVELTNLADLERVHALARLRLELAARHRRDLLAVAEPHARRFRVLRSNSFSGMLSTCFSSILMGYVPWNADRSRS